MKKNCLGILDVCFVILVCLKATGNSQLSWIETCIPLFAELCILILILPAVIKQMHIKSDKKKEDERLDKLDDIFKNDGV